MYSPDMFAGALIWLVAISALVGGVIVGVCFWLVPWLWTFIKPWLHTVTA